MDGCQGYAGRRGRLYKTGDLVQYNDDGNLVCLGRKDSQVKLRGQRIELGEIEHHLRECLPEATQMAVEVILPSEESKHATLAAFVRLEQDYCHIPAVDLFRNPRLDQLTAAATASTHASPVSIPQVEHVGPVAQSFAQGRLWFLEELHPGLTWYLMPLAVRIRGPLDLPALHSALLAVERRHETLRTTFATVDGASVQVVQPFQAKDLNIIDIVPGDEQGLAEAVQQEQGTVFNLRTQPGWRVTVYRVGEHDHVLSIVMHHIISDGWSVDVLMRELAGFYPLQCVAMIRSQVQPLPVQYRDFSLWQRQQAQADEHQKQLSYWVEQLQTSRPAELLCDKPRPAALSGQAGVQSIEIAGPLYVKLQSFCQLHGVTQFVVLLAAFRTAHFRLTGQDDATIGTVNANRDRWEIKDMIGFFVNMQCLRITAGHGSFEELVQQVHEVTIASHANADFVNGYGPTENTTFSATFLISPEGQYANGIPIGRALSNSGAFVMDAKLQLVPLGVVGELVVTGDGLARGYTDPARNIDRFVSVEIGGKTVRAYRTGDYVRHRPTDGQLEFFGRMDGQVKIRGNRVELGEVEHALRSDKAIREAVAVLQQHDGSEARLAGFVTVHEDAEIADEQDVESWKSRHLYSIKQRLTELLEAQLPAYMVPQTITILDAMPVNPNGKQPFRTEAAASTPAERAMQQLWAGVLAIAPDSIGLDDSFFRLGGDSIAAMKLVGEARRAGMHLTVADVFMHPILQDLARNRREVNDCAVELLLPFSLLSPATKEDILSTQQSLDTTMDVDIIVDILPVTHSQKIYLCRGLDDPRVAFNHFYVDIGPQLDLELLRDSCRKLVDHFSILRTKFVPHKQEWFQIVLRTLELPFSVFDVDQSMYEASHAMCMQDIKRTDPLEVPTSFKLLRNKSETSRLIVRLSHAQYDGVCLPVIFQTLVSIYQQEPLYPAVEFSSYLAHARRMRTISTVTGVNSSKAHFLLGLWRNSVLKCKNRLLLA
ncbi:hypothetical protein P3342_011838 [Pyrenophora teres f. teres]|nr:hypothetical protein P3342_011838 [Pyrenophora teres f. teres]